ncbi:ferredoxin [Pseudonocardia sp. GCM10023141]|uniref:ferredoxin n=1 Tax=Pseudonocardia sp. GCM10023141 TaxID=3252653 RepID=UPI003612CD4A
MMRATIDAARCQGHGRCAMLAPDVFDIDDDGWGTVLVDPVPATAEPDVREAVLNCPESAIALLQGPIRSAGGAWMSTGNPKSE